MPIRLQEIADLRRMGRWFETSSPASLLQVVVGALILRRGESPVSKDR